jgi:hypothetical protein
MNIDNFKTFLSRNSVAQESWDIYYNFSNITGGLVVLNELYPANTQFSGACVYASNNPGLIVGINTGGFAYDGSGYFSGDSIVRLSRTLDPLDWTIFMSYKNSGCQIQRDKSTILFSNQTNLSDSSGLCFGFNGANKFFIEYNNLTGKNTYTSKYEGKNSTLFSLSKNLNTFELSVHDPINSDDTLESFKLDNYQNSNIYYLGNSYNTFRDYTGFNGYMDDFLYFSGSIGATQRNNLARGIFSTQIIPSYTVRVVSGYNKISSSSITTGVVIGSGITGYQDISIGTIPRKGGGSIQICQQYFFPNFILFQIITEMSNEADVALERFTQLEDRLKMLEKIADFNASHPVVERSNDSKELLDSYKIQLLEKLKAIREKLIIISKKIKICENLDKSNTFAFYFGLSDILFLHANTKIYFKNSKNLDKKNAISTNISIRKRDINTNSKDDDLDSTVCSGEKAYDKLYVWGQLSGWFKQTVDKPNASLSAERRGSLSYPDLDCFFTNSLFDRNGNNPSYMFLNLD